ncbi:MAG: VCBS repeat-containing protein [Planctomycetota bacterium]
MFRAGIVLRSCLVSAVFAAAVRADDGLLAPVRLEHTRGVIDCGEAWGHASPAVHDVDGDGLEDLIVGDFSGTFSVYRNVGSTGTPAYELDGKLKAGGEEAKVWIYCCIGSQSRFGDLDGDGLVDMISNSYDPGHCYLFRGVEGNGFAAREELLDKSGTPVRSAPTQQQDYQSFGSFFELVDWDADGDLDVLIGCFDGKMMLRMNEGTPEAYAFAAENVPVEAAGEPMEVAKHLCPVVADWDGNGLWDIIAGAEDGSVTWFRNVGAAGDPEFAAGETLVETSVDYTSYRVRWADEDPKPGVRTQVEVTDYNGDGKSDLLVGDFYTAYDFKKGLTDEQRQTILELIAEHENAKQAFSDKFLAMREEFTGRYPGEEAFSGEAEKAWSDMYQELRESPEAKEKEIAGEVFAEALLPYLASTRNESTDVYNLAKSHGHVWLYLRK